MHPNPEKIHKVYQPMTETAFYILLALRQPRHGSGIREWVQQQTGGALQLGPGTLYGSLSKMERDGLIQLVREEDKRKIYTLLPLGSQVLRLECLRVQKQYAVIQRQAKEWLEDE